MSRENMTRIDLEDIRQGDLIREERNPNFPYYSAIEYVAKEDGWHPILSLPLVVTGRYLLDRPEPPFEPYWGMVIADLDEPKDMAVCMGTSEDLVDGRVQDWLTHRGWRGSEWAEQKLAEGWVIVENPEAGSSDAT